MAAQVELACFILLASAQMPEQEAPTARWSSNLIMSKNLGNRPETAQCRPVTVADNLADHRRAFCRIQRNAAQFSGWGRRGGHVPLVYNVL